MSHWHRLEITAVLERLDSDPRSGLSDDESTRRLEVHGFNELIELGGRGSWKILWEQLRGALVLLLIVAAVISAFLHEYTDAIAIMAIVVLNTILGFTQDYRAEKSLAALKKFAVPIVRVKRNGTVREISARDLVPGDVVLLEAGGQVPADCRLIECSNLKIQEAALTGESESIVKQTGALDGDDLPLGDRTNMAYKGTTVTYGRGSGLVVETGMKTELGHIATSLQTVESEPTPLQQRLGRLGRTLALVALGIVAIVFVMGILRGEELRLMLMTALSMAVAAVPEGLPAVATVALALGARRMFKRKALIRKLPAVETLGSVTVICSDKTGTLTENKMTVTVLDALGDRQELSNPHRRNESEGTSDAESLQQIGELQLSVAAHSTWPLLLTGAALCNDAQVESGGDQESVRAIGDPTEAALAVAAVKLGLPLEELKSLLPRIAEIPFDSDRKRMTTIHELTDSHSIQTDGAVSAVHGIVEQIADRRIALIKGAVDGLLDESVSVWKERSIEAMDDSTRQKIATSNSELAGRGMRVLGVAIRPLEEGVDLEDASEIERELVFVGMLGIIDPPRPEVSAAVARCRTAGIRPVMITGDHPLTAAHIAGEIGIAKDGTAFTGRELETLPDDDWPVVVEERSVYARVSPKHKLRLVQVLQKNGQIVAMTGDGVNDAPALKQAHIGIAMGITGTDVAKEASEMVLLDDNFATIVNAVEEGRIVYDNIRKFVKYTMTSNAGEIWVMVLGPFLGMPLPLLPLQILWINLVTDGLPGLALAVEKPERNTMQRPPFPPSEHIFGRGMGRDIAWIGLLMGVISLAMGYWYWKSSSSDEHWRTMVFTVLTLAQMGNALATRSDRDSFFQLGVFSNRSLIGSVLLTFALQMAVIYLPPMQRIFKTTALTPIELLMCLALSTVVFAAVELQKLIARIWSSSKQESDQTL